MIQDQGIPYNPLNFKGLLDESTILDDKFIGGYGIFFILKMMDEVNYKHDGQNNILTLIKYKEM